MPLPSLPGMTVEIVDPVEADVQAIPSEVEVVHLWHQVCEELEKVEGIFSLAAGRLRKLRKWQCRGFVRSVRVDFVTEKNDVLWAWFRRIREMVLEVGELDQPEFQDGSGI